MTAPLLEIGGLHVEFPSPDGDAVHAVNGANLTVSPGEIVALVGESGSGKTMTVLAVGRLLPRNAQWRADLLRFKGHDLGSLTESQVRTVLGQSLAYVFQDPASSLNPVMTIGEQLLEPLVIHRQLARSAARATVLDALTAVQLAEPAEKLTMFPHQLSGGMQQRVMLAMATLLRPALLVADEPTTALDATVQSQILTLLLTLRERTGMAIVLITHDLWQVAPMADRVAVMTQGLVVETAPTAQLYAAPQHPHTRALLDAMPHLRRPRC